MTNSFPCILVSAPPQPLPAVEHILTGLPALLRLPPLDQRENVDSIVLRAFIQASNPILHALLVSLLHQRLEVLVWHPNRAELRIRPKGAYECSINPIKWWGRWDLNPRPPGFSRFRFRAGYHTMLDNGPKRRNRATVPNSIFLSIVGSYTREFSRIERIISVS